MEILLSEYHSGREKTLYTLAVNLFEVDEIRGVLAMAQADADLCKQPVKEKAAFMRKQLAALAGEKKIELKLRKK